MLRIAITCGEGFSSGFLAGNLNIKAAAAGLSDDVLFIRIPYPDLYKRQDEVDVAMLLPVVHYKAVSDKREYKIPLYLIPYKAMLLPTVQDYIEDAEDIIKIAGGKGGVTRFPGEDRVANVTRECSYRKWCEEQKTKEEKKESKETKKAK